MSVTNNINLSAASGKSFNYEDVFYAYLNMPWDNPYDANGQPVYVDGTTSGKWWSRDKTESYPHHPEFQPPVQRASA